VTGGQPGPAASDDTSDLQERLQPRWAAIRGLRLWLMAAPAGRATGARGPAERKVYWALLKVRRDGPAVRVIWITGARRAVANAPVELPLKINMTAAGPGI
jgi:hypothetical protein